mgnify:CR=1 FL=1
MVGERKRDGECRDIRNRENRVRRWRERERGKWIECGKLACVYMF